MRTDRAPTVIVVEAVPEGHPPNDASPDSFSNMTVVDAMPSANCAVPGKYETDEVTKPVSADDDAEKNAYRSLASIFSNLTPHCLPLCCAIDRAEASRRRDTMPDIADRSRCAL